MSEVTGVYSSSCCARFTENCQKHPMVATLVALVALGAVAIAVLAIPQVGLLNWKIVAGVAPALALIALGGIIYTSRIPQTLPSAVSSAPPSPTPTPPPPPPSVPPMVFGEGLADKTPAELAELGNKARAEYQRRKEVYKASLQQPSSIAARGSGEWTFSINSDPEHSLSRELSNGLRTGSWDIEKIRGKSEADFKIHIGIQEELKRHLLQITITNLYLWISFELSSAADFDDQIATSLMNSRRLSDTDIGTILICCTRSRKSEYLEAFLKAAEQASVSASAAPAAASDESS